MKDKLTEQEIIRDFAAQPPATVYRNSDNPQCAYCGMPGVGTVGVPNHHYGRPDASRLRSPHLHFPDCAWRNAVEMVERWDKEQDSEGRSPSNGRQSALQRLDEEIRKASHWIVRGEP